MFKYRTYPSQVSSSHPNTKMMKKYLITNLTTTLAPVWTSTKKQTNIMMKKMKSVVIESSQIRFSMRSSYMMRWYRNKRKNKLNRRKSKKIRALCCYMAKSRRWRHERSRIAKLPNSSILNINPTMKRWARPKVSIKRARTTLIRRIRMKNKKVARRPCHQVLSPMAMVSLWRC